MSEELREAIREAPDEELELAARELAIRKQKKLLSEPWGMCPGCGVEYSQYDRQVLGTRFCRVCGEEFSDE